MIGVNPNRKFQYLACSVALVTDIRDKQVPRMDATQLVVLNAGGNDAHLATLLNYCIFTFAVWPWYSCDREIKSAQDAINAPQYVDDLRSLIAAVKGKLAGDTSRIYWNGYEKFFDTTTNQCDKISWSLNAINTAQYLTQARR